MAPRKLKVAVSGLGRMGARHAMFFLNRAPRAVLVAAFSPDERELAWAREHLQPHGVELYSDFDQMLAHSGLEAVVIATITSVHAEQSIKSMRAGKHVLCEKPLSTSVEISQSVLNEALAHPHLKILCGFSRRFDASYRSAHARTASGSIGEPCIFRSQTCDKLDPSGFFVQYAQHSGGIFVDCSIHDIDLALWFLGSTPSPNTSTHSPSSSSPSSPSPLTLKSVSGFGITAVAPELARFNDVDNAVGVVEFWNGKLAYFYASRMMAAGQHDMTEIVGTRGKLVVNANPAAELVEMWEAGGIRREIPRDYWGRFEAAFGTEANEFVACVLDGKELPFGLEGAVRAVEIGAALQESLRSGRKIWFDEQGRRVERGRL